MQFGILFTSQPHLDNDAYPHHSVHARVTEDIQLADRLGYDVAWLAEHHFSNTYGIMPDVMTYASYLTPLTEQITLGAAVVVLPLNNPVRVVENANFIDVLSGGRMALGFGSGYRQYEYDGLGVDFETRREHQKEELEVVMDLLYERRTDRSGTFVKARIAAPQELFPHPVQTPHPPLYMAVASEFSMALCAHYGMGAMISSIPTVETCATQAAQFRGLQDRLDNRYAGNKSRGEFVVNRFVHVAESDDEARRESEDGVLRHLDHFLGQGDYVNMVQHGGKNVERSFSYDSTLGDIILHGSPDTVAGMIADLQEKTGMTGLILHYPPYYGTDAIRRSLTLFAEEVIPRFRNDKVGAAAAE